MSPALVASMVFTVALLVVTAYFFFGSVPLLVLRHDDPMDARFVRGFYNTYYLAATVVATGTAISDALAGRPVLAGGAAAIALVAAILRQRTTRTMEALRGRIESGEVAAIGLFRRSHVLAIVINFIQLALIVWALIALSPK